MNNNNMNSKTHISTKPGLFAATVTGGFGVTRKNKKGDNHA